jgi:hypothetical protein
VSVGAVDVEFYNSGDGGLVNISFFGCTATDVINGFVITGGQAYSGSESAPMILTGSYPEISNEVIVSSTGTAQTNGTVTIVPEPSTAGLSAAGLLLAAATFLWKRPAASTPSARR